MTDARTLRYIFQLREAHGRREAAAALARHLGADVLFAFVRDPELHVLLPAPGLTQTHPGGPSWRTLLDACVAPGRSTGAVAFPDQASFRPATAFTLLRGAVFVFLGEPPSLDEASLEALEVVAALFEAEQAAVIARGAAAAAHSVAEHASALAGALDATRADLQAALGESARLNSELERAATGERRARAEAEAANRAKDEFLAMLGHELRNPLAPIVTALQLMALRGHDRAPELAIIERQIEHVIRLVDDLLDISRITRGMAALERSPIELAEVVAKAVEMASPLLEQRRHHFAVSVPSRGMLLDADEGRLAQVISNLLTNAARYTPPGGDISLRATRRHSEIEIVVRDSGTGIDPDVLPHIFELFVQGKPQSGPSNGGLGLGLALVQNLVALHGGTVEARSEGQNRGSTFVVRLPALPVGTIAEPNVPAALALPNFDESQRLRILIVDDNSDAAALLGEALRLHGHAVAIAHDGPAALALVDTFRPDVAILDIGLPVMDGHAVARELRAREGGRETRLIALTGYGQASDRSRSEAAGFESHLVKPVRLDELMTLL